MKREFMFEGEPANAPAPSVLIDIVFPGDTNHHGTLFGGGGLARMDRVAFIAATRFGRVPFVTASCERLDFRQPPRLGEIIRITARPVGAGTRSLTVAVTMEAECLSTGDNHLCTSGIFHMVALPGQERPDDWLLPRLSEGEEPGDEPDTLRMVELVFPDQANSYGRMFGGEALAAMTKAAFVMASRHRRQLTVLASSERVDFRQSIEVGSIVEVVARVADVGRSSMRIDTQLWSEELLSGRRCLTAQGRYAMVAVYPAGRPVPVIPRDVG